MENVISAKIYMPRIPSLTWAFEQTELDVHKGVEHWTPEENKNRRKWETCHIRPKFSHLEKSDWQQPPLPFFSLIKVQFFFRRSAYEMCLLLSLKGEVFNVCATSGTKKNSNNNEWMKFKVNVWKNPDLSHSNKHIVWAEIYTSVQSILKEIDHPKMQILSLITLVPFQTK